MAEGLSASEVGKEIGHHAAHARHEGVKSGHDRLITIGEALLLSVVTLLAAWSGYSAAKWGTESSLKLAKASATRAHANRLFQQALTFRTGDGLLFNAWLSAYFQHDAKAMQITARRFRPDYRPAFEAWLKTHPFTNPDAPGGPQLMPQYHPPGEAESKVLDAQADDYYAEGQKDAERGDNYVRTTVILASVLFLVGVSTQFPLRQVRYGLLVVGSALLLFGVFEIVSLPPPP